MKKVTLAKMMVFSFGWLYLLFPQNANAYLDPGTGSYVLQVFIAAIAGLFFAIKIYWTKLRVFLTSIFSKKSRAGVDKDE